jgi:hypothetical protein
VFLHHYDWFFFIEILGLSERDAFNEIIVCLVAFTKKFDSSTPPFPLITNPTFLANVVLVSHNYI